MNWQSVVVWGGARGGGRLGLCWEEVLAAGRAYAVPWLRATETSHFSSMVLYHLQPARGIGFLAQAFLQKERRSSARSRLYRTSQSARSARPPSSHRSLALLLSLTTSFHLIAPSLAKSAGQSREGEPSVLAFQQTSCLNSIKQS